MRPLALLALLAVPFVVTGCFADFSGDGGQVQFNSSLSRGMSRWTPRQPVALGQVFRIAPDPGICVGFCDGGSPYSFDGGDFTGDGGVLALALDGGWLMAIGEGEQLVRYTGRDADFFTVTVKRAEQLRLTDPLVLSQPDWWRLLADPTPLPFPDVGEEVVMGEDAFVRLDLIALDDAGLHVGVGHSGFAVRGGRAGLTIASGDDHRQVELHSRDAGASTVLTASLSGGIARTWQVRVAPITELRELTLFAREDLSHESVIVRAVARREDGGLFLEAPLTWTLPTDVREIDYGDTALGLRTRTDLKQLSQYAGDGGLRTVTVSAAGIEARLVHAFAAELPPLEDADAGAPLPRTPVGCGCMASPGGPEALLALLAVLKMRRPRHT